MPVDMPKFPTLTMTYRLSNKKLTVAVKVRDGKILDAAPVVRVFIGQPLSNLVSWMNKIGPTDMDTLNVEEDTIKKRDPYA